MNTKHDPHQVLRTSREVAMRTKNVLASGAGRIRPLPNNARGTRGRGRRGLTRSCNKFSIIYVCCNRHMLSPALKKQYPISEVVSSSVSPMYHPIHVQFGSASRQRSKTGCDAKDSPHRDRRARSRRPFHTDLPTSLTQAVLTSHRCARSRYVRFRRRTRCVHGPRHLTEATAATLDRDVTSTPRQANHGI